MQNRQNALEHWVEKTLTHSKVNLLSLTGDASFRRYYRLHHNNTSYIVMDAPPEKEPLRPFIEVGQLLHQHQLHTPVIHAIDEHQGFAILEDFGDLLLLNALRSTHSKPAAAETLYIAALNMLTLMQRCTASTNYPLPLFDKNFMLSELDVFKTWYLGTYLHVALSPADNQLLNDTFSWLTDTISSQPQVFIHRDFHSRNLMILDDQLNLGIIDFQDAMQGPLTYDLVSLLKDCYIQWPIEQVERWLKLFYDCSSQAQQLSLSEFKRSFDLCGLQRHLKVLGVFCRLHLRDHKPHYLNDLPLTWHYVMSCLESYPELQPFYQFMQQKGQLPS